MVLFFFNLFLIGGKLLYDVVLVSATQQRTSAIIRHISPPSATSMALLMEVITSCPDVRCMLICPTRFWALSVDQWLPWRLSVKESACPCRRCRFDPLGGEESLEEETATYSSILAKIIP